MASRQNSKNLGFPIFSVCFYKNWVLVSGGGGGQAFGIRNKLILYNSSTMESITEEDTGSDLLSKIIQIPNKDLFLCILGNDLSIYKVDNKPTIKQQTRSKCENKKNLLSISLNQNTIISGGEEGFLRVWQLNSHNELTKKQEIYAEWEIHCCDMNEKFICAALSNKTCGIYSVDGAKLKSLQFCEIGTTPMMVKSCYFVKDKLITLQSGFKSSSYLTKWDLNNNFCPIASAEVYVGAAPYMKVSKSGRIVAIGCSDGSAVVVRLQDWKKLYKQQVFELPVMAADFNQTENLLIIGSASNDYSFVEIGRRSWVTIFSVGVFISTLAYFII